MENKNEPVYPVKVQQLQGEIEYYGLTKREYFTGLAMQGLVSNLRQTS